MESLRVLRRNPQMAKAAVAAGLQATGGALVYALVVGPLKTQVWGEHQSERQSQMAMATSIFATVSSYYFGSFSDKFDRRISVAIFGLCNFLPAWALLVFGLGRTGLWTFMGLQILSGLGASSNVMLVLANDVTRKEDRELAFGTFYALSTLISLLGQGIPVLLIVTFEVIPNSPTLAVWIQVGVSVAFFLLVATIHQAEEAPPLEDQPTCPIRTMTIPTAATLHMQRSQFLMDERLPATSEEDSETTSTTASTPGQALESDGSLEEGQDEKQRTCGCCSCCSSLAAPFTLLCNHRMLAVLCLVTALLEFAQDLTFDIGGQFFMESLDLIHHGSLRQQQMVTVLSSIPAQVFSIFAFAAVGVLASRFSSLSMLKCMIPMAAVMVMAGGLMRWFPHMWFIPIVCITENAAGLTSIPLQLLITEIAPENRIAEVMGVVGMSKQLVGFAGNAVVSTMTPLLMHSGIHNPLWIYYPVCGCLKLLALLTLPLLKVPKAVQPTKPEREATIKLARTQTLAIARTQTLPSFAPDVSRRTQMF